jgi:sugar diacid utilization regulator
VLTRRSLQSEDEPNDALRATPRRAGARWSPRHSARADANAEAEPVAHRLAASRTDTSALLALVLLSGDVNARNEVARWTMRAGLDISEPFRVVLVTSSAGVSTEHLVMHVGDCLRASTSQPVLVTTLGTAVAAVRPADEPSVVVDEWRRVVQALQPRVPTLRVAIGGSGTWPAGVRASLEQARSLVALQREGSPLTAVPDIVVFETVGVIGSLMGSCGRDLLAFAHRVLQPLLDDHRCGGELLDTLHAYLASAGSTGQAAEVLHLHPSSVKYRLKVIRQLIGRDRLEDPNARFELELAVRVAMAMRQLDVGPADAAV